MVPHGELKLIICDNLSASENSNMSTKLREPQRGVGERKKKSDKRKGEGKEKGASFLHGGKKKCLPSRLNGKCFRRLI